ncbi:MAG: regulatory signaling modulator protein AmpE [Gammaproteobacteria bacterium]|nr:regulatory signaling modulator protein AmpE [Gammaproteobacteria bacterium]MCD8543117.1 regulatory signaling modulator protein AmpE [Gammaproteobacteria bacterium]
MALVIILLALLIERIALFIHPIRDHYWFERYSQKLARLMCKNAYLSLSFGVLPLILAVYLAHIFLARISFGWPSWIFDLAILVYCLGNTHLHIQTRECYEQIDAGNIETARDLLREHFDVIESGDVTASVLLKAFYRASLQRIFSILFWFVLLGPAGAIFYRLLQKLSIYREDGVIENTHRLAAQLTAVLDWVPARLLAFTFCLAGHFIDIFTQWRAKCTSGLNNPHDILYECGYVAVNVNDSLTKTVVLAQFDEAYYLVCRSLFIWLVVLALVILF